jgi:CMP/dCMP kinase
MSDGVTVAIDGPAGAGKSTLARLLARDLDYTYLDSGAMYRAVGVLAGEIGVALDDAEALATLCETLEFGFPWIDGELRTVVDGRDMSDLIRTPDASMNASTVSKVPAVRSALVAAQRRLGSHGGVVMEGRDIGTVVFPKAELKVFLTASARVRGERRWRQLREQGIDRTLEDVVTEVEARDYQDSTRSVSPLRPAGDSVVLDTSKLGINRVRRALRRLVAARLEGLPDPALDADALDLGED